MPSFDDQHFAKALRVKRAERKWTQNELADAAGLSTGTIAHYELGDTSPTIAKVCKIANAFGCPIDDFVIEGDA